MADKGKSFFDLLNQDKSIQTALLAFIDLANKRTLSRKEVNEHCHSSPLWQSVVSRLKVSENLVCDKLASLNDDENLRRTFQVLVADIGKNGPLSEQDWEQLGNEDVSDRMKKIYNTIIGADPKKAKPAGAGIRG